MSLFVHTKGSSMSKRKSLAAESEDSQQTDTSSESSASGLLGPGPNLRWPDTKLFTLVEQAPTDPACSSCDDGGIVAPCDGLCMRSFHMGIDWTETAKLYSKGYCNPLALPKDLAMHLIEDNVFFECPSCLAQRHHCFACYEEGNADPNLPFTDKTVARCVMLTCGKFYHPGCIKKTANQINTGEFVCPRHTCELRVLKGKCNVPKDKKEELIECRRCPTAFHRVCIPETILKTQGFSQGKRVWFKGHEVDRSLIYCMKHKIPAHKENPPLDCPLFSPELLADWRRHMCQQHPNLSSSGSWRNGQKKNTRAGSTAKLVAKQEKLISL